MALYYCVEDEYRNTPWCIETVEGLNSEIKRKKQTVKEIKDIGEITSDDERSSVIIIGSLINWISEMISKVSEKGMMPIVLSNISVEYTDKMYSKVSSDVYGAICTAIAAVRNNGKGRIALYGINPHSASDTLRKNVFLKLGYDKKDVYYNNSSLEKCFNSFFALIDDYDTVICANDSVAVSLVTRLKSNSYDLSRLYIISCSDGILLSKISPTVTAFSRNFKAFGKAAVSTHEAFSKNPDIAFTDTHIKYGVNIRETTKDLVLGDDRVEVFAKESEEAVSIYCDAELLDIMKAENLIRNCDPIDMKIIDLLYKKQTYESIAEALFISISAVKYRLKNLCKLVEVSSNKDLVEFLSKYYKP